MKGAAAGGVLLALLVTACQGSAEPAAESPASSPASPASPTPVPPPPTPAPSSLADRLETAYAVLAGGEDGEQVRAAAELQQLAARSLANRPEVAAQRLLARLTPAVRRSMRANEEAARLLSGMTSPQPKFPQWRIVEPPAPEELRGYYRSAERQIGVPWEYLAAIHLVETRMGRIRGTSTAGAQGPMQFLPSTWAAYGAGGDINDPGDAILGAARLLRANGAPGNMADALWNYNHSDAYVRAVTLYAEEMQRDPRAYVAYWHWRVLYKHRTGSFVLPTGYPENPAVRTPDAP